MHYEPDSVHVIIVRAFLLIPERSSARSPKPNVGILPAENGQDGCAPGLRFAFVTIETN